VFFVALLVFKKATRLFAEVLWCIVHSGEKLFPVSSPARACSSSLLRGGGYNMADKPEQLKDRYIEA